MERRRGGVRHLRLSGTSGRAGKWKNLHDESRGTLVDRPRPRAARHRPKHRREAALIEEELVGDVGRSDAGELTSVDHRRSAPPPCSSPSRRHPLLPVRAAPCRHPLPQRSATPLPTAGARWRHAAGKLPATPSTTSEAATLPFLAAPARILGELRRWVEERKNSLIHVVQDLVRLYFELRVRLLKKSSLMQFFIATSLSTHAPTRAN